MVGAEGEDCRVKMMEVGEEDSERKEERRTGWATPLNYLLR